MNRKSILLFSMLVLFNACKTVDQNVQQLVHTRKAVVAQMATDPYKSKYIANMQGNYQLLGGEPFTIDANGTFKIGDIDYFVHQAISETQGVYVAVTPDPNSSKNVYTYHGIITSGSTLLSAPYKRPQYGENKPELTEKDTPFAWQVNTFQPENINWASGFSTVFANKVDLPS